MATSSASTLRKVCPQCSTTVHVRRAVCGCGYAFPSKRRARPDSVSQAMKHQRVHKANVRASETPVQTLYNADRVNFKSRNYHVVAYNISILAEGLYFSALV